MLTLEFEIHGASFCIALTKMDIDSIYNSAGDDIFCFFLYLTSFCKNDHSANIFFINFHKNLGQAIATLCWIIVESCKCAMPCAL